MRFARLALVFAPLAALYACGEDAFIPDEASDAGSDQTVGTDEASLGDSAVVDASDDALLDAGTDGRVPRDDHEILFITRSPIRLWKVRPDGGDPIQLSEESSLGGRWMLGFQRIAHVVDIGGGTIQTMLPDGGDVATIGTGSLPGWSEAAGRLVFERANDMYTMLPDGGDEVRLTFDGLAYRSPVWSPDGKRIAARSANQELCIFTPTVNPTRKCLLRCSTPSWHPDGKRVVCHLAHANGGDLYIVTVDADGGAPVQLTDAGLNFEAAWSPDGTQIVFSKGPGPDNAGADLHIMNADGTNVRRILTLGTQAPDWR